MSHKEFKCAMIIDAALPVGVIANTAAILGVTLGKQFPELVGPDVLDASNRKHLGIVTIPVPILNGSSDALRDLRAQLLHADFSDVAVVDFSDVAQKINVYADFVQKSLETPESEHHYYGIALFGDKKKINRLTGMLPLLRA